ncbi:MAG: glycosyltransferase family 39 protein, partial [Planctomycetota bacterium]
MTRPVLLGMLASTLIAAFAALRVADLAWRMSPTYDEPKHLATGLTYLAQGWCCFGKDNTPMVGLNAAPLYAMGALPRLDVDDARLAVTAPAGQNPIRVRYYRARLANLILLFLVLGGVAALCGRAYGRATGVLAALCLSLEPNLIANAALVSPDFHVTATMTLALLALAVQLDRGWSIARVLASGVAIGAALLSKYNALVLIPVALAVAASLPAARWRERGARVLGAAAACLVGAATVALAYQLPRALGGLCGLGWWPFPDTALASALRQAVDPPVQDGIAYGFLGGLD